MEIGTGQDKGHSSVESRVKSQPGGKSKWKFVLWAIMKAIDWWAGVGWRTNMQTAIKTDKNCRGSEVLRGSRSHQ